MKIVADDKIPFLQGVLEPFAEVLYYPGAKITPEIVKDADALIVRTRTKCNTHLLEGSSVKFIATATIGFDHIDTVYCEKTGITWTNAPGCNSSSVQQYIANVLSFLSKKHGFKLKDRTLGIVGVGYVGKKVLKMAEDLGLRIVINDPPRSRKEGLCGFVSLEGILREADIITFHVPLNMDGEDKTYHLADTSFFEKVNPGTFIINSSRGEVVDTIALKDALDGDKLAGAVIDVWEYEPEIDQELLQKVDIGTPHIAGYSLDGKANGTSMSVNALCKFFNLPYTGWEPATITPIDDNLIEIDCNGKTNEDVLLEAVDATFQLESDSNALKANPEVFEKYRGEYPLRREYQAYKVYLENATDEMNSLLLKYGFILA